MLLTAVEYIEGTPTTISETRDKGTLASETRVTAAEIHLTELKKNNYIIYACEETIKWHKSKRPVLLAAKMEKIKIAQIKPE